MASRFLLLTSLLIVCHFVPGVHPTIFFVRKPSTVPPTTTESSATLYEVDSHPSPSVPVGCKMPLPLPIKYPNVSISIFDHKKDTITVTKTAIYVFHLTKIMATNTVSDMDICLMVNGEKNTSLSPKNWESFLSLAKQIPLVAGDRAWVDVGCGHKDRGTSLDIGSISLSGHLCESI